MLGLVDVAQVTAPEWLLEAALIALSLVAAATVALASWALLQIITLQRTGTELKATIDSARESFDDKIGRLDTAIEKLADSVAELVGLRHRMEGAEQRLTDLERQGDDP